ncbi:hypothetical protein AVEN_70995-1 [Araneus ventricosus]|uniref:Uncharacterized protein n=1 Tax=Araneus ventricosus TaxID=182803 RepID=A0A4Y2G972_ARAVE|nr:hypothetical protein AVEN_70995-1 [Araneus ventricosus]
MLLPHISDFNTSGRTSMHSKFIGSSIYRKELSINSWQTAFLIEQLYDHHASGISEQSNYNQVSSRSFLRPQIREKGEPGRMEEFLFSFLPPKFPSRRSPVICPGILYAATIISFS